MRNGLVGWLDDKLGAGEGGVGEGCGFLSTGAALGLSSADLVELRLLSIPVRKEWKETPCISSNVLRNSVRRVCVCVRGGGGGGGVNEEIVAKVRIV